MTKLKIYNRPMEFWNEVSPFLKKEEAKNSLCLGQSYTFNSNPTDCLYQSALFQDLTFLGSLVVSKYKTHHNFLPSPTSDITVARKLYNEFQKSELSIMGLIGEKGTANIYKDLFEENGKKTKTNMVQGVYRCDKVRIPTCQSNLNFRVADERDIKKIGQWISSFHAEAVPHDPPIDAVELAKAKIDKQMVYVLERNGDLVSMAAWSRDIETSCSLNLVYTPQSLRKKGYASLVTAKLTQHLLESGKKETNLYTDMSNPTSNKIYMDIGYEFVCDSVHFGVMP